MVVLVAAQDSGRPSSPLLYLLKRIDCGSWTAALASESLPSTDSAVSWVQKSGVKANPSWDFKGASKELICYRDRENRSRGSYPGPSSSFLSKGRWVRKRRYHRNNGEVVAGHWESECRDLRSLQPLTAVCPHPQQGCWTSLHCPANLRRKYLTRISPAECLSTPIPNSAKSHTCSCLTDNEK